MRAMIRAGCDGRFAESNLARMLFRRGWRTWKVAALILVAVPPACAQRVSVEQLQQTLTTLKAARASDRAMAQTLRSLQLTERLTRPTLARMEAELKPRRATRLALELLSCSSSFLDAPAAEFPREPRPDAAAERSMLSAARSYVATTLQRMPNFLATRITRSFDNSSIEVHGRDTSPTDLRLIGTASQGITYRYGRDTLLESTRRKLQSDPEVSGEGLASAGEFGPILGTIFGDFAKGTITWSHWENTAAGPAAVFRYQVPQAASTYVVDFCCVSAEYGHFPGNFYHGTPPYHGSLSIDPSTGAILRLTLEAELDPTGPLIDSRISVDYGSVEIGGKSYICPQESVVVALARIYLEKQKRETAILRLNEVVFTKYHRFGSSVRMLTDPLAQ